MVLMGLKYEQHEVGTSLWSRVYVVVREPRGRGGPAQMWGQSSRERGITLSRDRVTGWGAWP